MGSCPRESCPSGELSCGELTLWRVVLEENFPGEEMS